MKCSFLRMVDLTNANMCSFRSLVLLKYSSRCIFSYLGGGAGALRHASGYFYLFFHLFLHLQTCLHLEKYMRKNDTVISRHSFCHFGISQTKLIIACNAARLKRLPSHRSLAINIMMVIVCTYSSLSRLTYSKG